ncbi:MAG: hypothetical protein M0Q37_11410 [Sphaerochaeta sp.]|jgi:hypothetical protein|nr:hypothetical protein [Sphaerochaeta sp.]
MSMVDAYIGAVLSRLDRREREYAQEQLKEIFALSTDVTATIGALGHPADCAIRFYAPKRWPVNREYRHGYRKSLAIAMASFSLILLLLLLIPPFFQPVRITASLLLQRALAAIFTALILSLGSVTLVFFILSSRPIVLKRRRWDEETMVRTLSIDDLAIKSSTIVLDMMFSLLWLGFLLTLLLHPLVVVLQGRPVFSVMVRPVVVAWMLLALCSLILDSVKLKRRRYSRRLVVLESTLDSITLVYTTVVLTRWHLYHPDFVQLVGQARLKIVVQALLVIWIALTVLERANDVYTIFRSTAPEKA